MKDKIIDALKTVYDPEIPVNIWDLGLVYDVEIKDDGFIEITMTMTSPTCPETERIVTNARWAVGQVNGVKHVYVKIVWEPAWDVSKMSMEARAELDLTDMGW